MTSDQHALAELRLAHAPVAISFVASPPPGLPRVPRAEAAGCGYWKRASNGETFYTVADDHANCPVGAYTHGVQLTTEQSQQLQGLVGTIIELKYLTPDEIPALPRREAPMQVAVYAPLGASGPAPDVVVFRGNVRQVMLLSEAARAAGVFDNARVMGRPACAMVPQAIASSSTIASVGCIGNRVYTELADDEMYLTVPGASVARVVEQVAAILRANRELEAFHRQRAAAVAAV